MDGNREQEPLYRLTAYLALFHGVVGHPLKALELMFA